MRVSYGSSKTSFPELFQNERTWIYTIRIDSRRLEKIESEDPEATRDEAAKELREIVNTVGKIGRPGQDVRCVVSSLKQKGRRMTWTGLNIRQQDAGLQR